MVHRDRFFNTFNVNISSFRHNTLIQVKKQQQILWWLKTQINMRPTLSIVMFGNEKKTKIMENAKFSTFL